MLIYIPNWFAYVNMVAAILDSAPDSMLNCNTPYRDQCDFRHVHYALFVTDLCTAFQHYWTSCGFDSTPSIIRFWKERLIGVAEESNFHTSGEIQQNSSSKGVNFRVENRVFQPSSIADRHYSLCVKKKGFCHWMDSWWSQMVPKFELMRQ